MANLASIRAGTLVAAVLLSSATAGQSTFQRSYGGVGSDHGRAVAALSNGFLVAGYSNSFFDPSSDAYFLRLDQAGNYIWGRNIGEPNTIEAVLGVASLLDNRFVACGYTNANVGMGYQAYVLILDELGQVLSAQNFGGTDWDFFYGVCTDTAGNILLCGSKTTENHPQAWLVKLNQNGELLWEYELPSSQDGSFTGVALCEDGSIVTSGTLVHPLLGSSTVMAARFTEAGTLLWSRDYPEWGQAEAAGCDCSAGGSRIVGAGRVLVNDSTTNFLRWGVNSSSGDQEVFFEENNPGRGRSIAVAEAADGKLLYAGVEEFFGLGGLDAISVMFNADGVYLGPELSELFSGQGDEVFYSIAPTADGGYVACGETTSFGNASQVYLVKVSAEGDRDTTNQDYLDLLTPVSDGALPARVKLYPNPVVESIQICGDIGVFNAYRIYDAGGRAVKSGELTASTCHTLDVRALARGGYVLCLESRSHQTCHQFVVVH